ncbi:hypothetical protein GCM10010468_75470 [Actinocorallia longicatena]|uniref:Uncharacterized protein n=2 Tax=Actinocorallia longicatena TaxID=111803 RepID=A0ABP6QL69_9ACTN
MIVQVAIAVVFVVFLVGGGLVLPLLGMVEDARDHRPALTPKPDDGRRLEAVRETGGPERERIAA